MGTTAGRQHLPLRVALAVGIVAGTTLALQVLLTRLFSWALFYHYTYLVISLALLGVGGGAILVYARPRWFERGGIEVSLARWCLALAVLLLVVPLVLVRVDFPREGTVNFDFVSVLALSAVLSALPFLAAGILIALAIKRYVGSVARLYAFDLAGAGAGAAAIVPLLWLSDPPTLIVAMGAISGLAVALFAWGAAPWRQVGFGLLAGGCVLVAVSSTTSVYDPGLDAVASDRWSPLSRVVGYRPSSLFGRTYALVRYDLDVAPVPVVREGEPPQGWRRLEVGPQSIGYELTRPGADHRRGRRT